VSPRTRSRQARDEHSSPPHGLRRYLRFDIVAAVAAIVVVLVAGVLLLDEPARVDRITIDNPSAFVVDVSVTSGGHHGWLVLSGIPVAATRDYHDVLDQGDTWVFSFRAQGRDGGELSVSRADLATRNWTMEIPATVIDRLRAGGAPAHP
jgi:hypothetical protein